MDRTVCQPDLLVAEDLSVGHGTAPVCAPVDLRPAAGRAVAVVGPNGSGTSTLLRTLVGLLEPLDGTVAFAGAPVDERSSAFRRDVAAVLDDDAFFVSLTGREHLLLTARGHGVAAARRSWTPRSRRSASASAPTRCPRSSPPASGGGWRWRPRSSAPPPPPPRLLVLVQLGRRRAPGS
ncbi:ABC transporter ATP-binding protein [Geodermatophilus sp. URMC 65]